MVTKFKDVAHLYLGCECITIKPYTEGTVKIIEVHQGKWVRVVGKYSPAVMSINFLKPILRKRESLKESEAAEIFDELYPNETDNSIGYKAGSIILMFGKGDVQYPLIPILLKKGFDLFNLIPSGQAIDKTTLTTTQTIK